MQGQKLDQEALQADRNAGISVAEIAKKHDCSSGSVYMLTKKPKRESRATPPSTPKAGRKRGSFDGAGMNGVLKQLRAKRQAIDRAIAALEEIDA